MQPILEPRRGSSRHTAVVACAESPCVTCRLAWCDAPWSSGRTGCPACLGRTD